MTSETAQAIRSRFWAKVDVRLPNECWLWIGAKNTSGYGTFKLRNRQRLAHRVSYWLAHNVEPGAARVCHSCDTPRCVNPAHLWLGTDADNNADKAAKGRAHGGKQDGASNPRAQLTEADVRSIVELFRTGKGNTPIGRQFNVSHATIGMIRNGKTWAAFTKRLGWKPERMRRGRPSRLAMMKSQ